MVKKETIDELYHKLRLVSIEGSVTEKLAVFGLTTHLMRTSGDYRGLLAFLNNYGENYLMPHVIKVVERSGVEFDRVVDLGCGFCWLGRGLAAARNLPGLFIDKRQWTLVDIVADIETENGVKRIMDELRPSDLIVMGELIHCIADPLKVLGPLFKKWPCVVIEYNPGVGSEYESSYNAQVGALGCVPVVIEDFLNKVDATYEIVHYHPHAIAVTKPMEPSTRV